MAITKYVTDKSLASILNQHLFRHYSKRTKGTIVEKSSDALDSDKRMNLHGYRKHIGILVVLNVGLRTAKMKSGESF